MKSQLRAALTIMVMCILALPAGCAGKQAGYRPAPPPGPAQSVLALVVYYPKLTQTDAYLVREVHMVQLPAGAAADPKLAAVEELIGEARKLQGRSVYYRRIPGCSASRPLMVWPPWTSPGMC